MCTPVRNRPLQIVATFVMPRLCAPWTFFSVLLLLGVACSTDDPHIAFPNPQDKMSLCLCLVDALVCLYPCACISLLWARRNQVYLISTNSEKETHTNKKAHGRAAYSLFPGTTTTSLSPFFHKASYHNVNNTNNNNNKVCCRCHINQCFCIRVERQGFLPFAKRKRHACGHDRKKRRRKKKWH